MRIVKAVFIFYKKVIVPAIILSGLLGFIGSGTTLGFSFRNTGLACFILVPFFHYFIYEVRNYNEYYFYYNMGLSRLSLWVLTFGISAVIGLISILA
jgi:hypothetical protein